MGSTWEREREKMMVGGWRKEETVMGICCRGKKGDLSVCVWYKYKYVRAESKKLSVSCSFNILDKLKQIYFRCPLDINVSIHL